VQVLSLIFLCIVIIFGFEVAGLVNRETNLILRNEIANGICKINFNISANRDFYKSQPSNKESLLSNSFTNLKVVDLHINKDKIKLMNQEYNIKHINEMLIEAVKENIDDKTDLPKINEFYA